MRILVLGNLGSIYMRDFVSNISIALPDSSIDVITSRKGHSIESPNVKIRIFSGYSSNSLISKIPKLRAYISLRKKRKLLSNLYKLDKYDITHLHFIDLQSSLLYKELKRTADKLILSVWGSDFYRSSPWMRKIQKNLYDVASLITFGNNITKEEFIRFYGERFRDRCRIARFGLSPLSELKAIENLSQAECRNKLNIPTSSKVITIGYNNDPNQQHLKILKSISKYKNDLPKDTFLILPMTYGGDNNYKNQVISEIKKLKIPFVVYDRFLQDREVAFIRKASDIMIQLQTTDQFSGSMQEHLYAENIVITGDWLPYDILDERGVFMLKVSSVDEVGNKLLYAINNMNELKNKCRNNPKIIWELSSWERNINKWLEIYEEVLRGKNE